MRNSLNSTPSLVGSIKVTGTVDAPSAYLFYKYDLSNYTIVAGDRLRLEMYLDEASVACNPEVDLVLTVGTTGAFTDQNGVMGATLIGVNTPDIAPFARGKWYSRDFDLTDYVGSISDYFRLGFTGSTTGIVTFYVKKVRIISNTGTLRKSYYTEGDAAPTLASNANVSSYSASIIQTGSGATIASTSAVLKGNAAGSAVAATPGTDFAPATSGSSILYGNGAGGFSNVAIGTGVAFAGGTLSAGGGTSATIQTTALVLKGDAAGNAVAATAGTDYLQPAGNGSALTALSGTAIASGTVANARLTTAMQRFVAATTTVSGATPAVDWSLGTSFKITLSANATFTFTNATDGWEIIVAVTNTASNYSVTWPASIRWIAGTYPTQTLGAFTDFYGFRLVGTQLYGAVLQNMS